MPHYLKPTLDKLRPEKQAELMSAHLSYDHDTVRRLISEAAAIR